MAHRTRSDRYAYYLTRAAQATWHGLRPSAVAGRLRGPRVLLNSIPKSGTHLLERALEHFPWMRHDVRRTVVDWHELSPHSRRRLARLGRGQFALAHLPWLEGLPELLERRQIRTVFMVRDPRDVLLSFCNYVTEINLTHPAHTHFAALPDHAARLSEAMRGVKGLVAPIEQLLERFEPWLSAPGVAVVRFEELVGPQGGGNPERQLAAIGRIAEFLGIELSEADVRAVADAAYSTRSSTFRSGRTGQWRQHFRPDQVAELKQRAGELLVRYGYETDLRW